MIRVYIGQADFILGNVGISIVNHYDGSTGAGRIYRPGEMGGSWEEFDPLATAAIEPSFKLPGEVGRALLDALARHYEGAEDTRRLRADYDAALRRADDKDKLIADVLRSLTGQAGGPR